MPKKSSKLSIIIHYSEIGLKKNNRPYFEKKFISNIINHIKDLKYDNIRLISARVIIDNIELNDWKIYKESLNNVMGLSSALLVIKSNHDIISIYQAIDSILKEETSFNTYRVSTRRHFKGFEKTSIELNIDIGSYIQQKVKKNVSLSNPDLNIIIEILKDKCYVGYKKIIGYGGLPAMTQEKAISLISSGIDSPVASFEMIKRGVEVHFVHFHSYPSISKQSIENTKEIVTMLSKYQLNTSFYSIPLLQIQEKIMEIVDNKYWVIFFRRAMIEISNIIATKINAIALITGESVGQVASQTLSNIRAIATKSNLPILRPLSGMNKDQIVTRAKEIGTYEISIKPYEDCCSYFVPAHPETKAKIDRINFIEKKLDIKNEIHMALENTEKIKIKFLEE